MPDNPYTAPQETTAPSDIENVAKRPSGGTILQSVSITLARATSYASALMALGGFATSYAYQASSVRIIGEELWGLSGPIGLIGFFLCCIAATVNTRADLERRPLLLAMPCIAIVFCLGLFAAPVIG